MANRKTISQHEHSSERLNRLCKIKKMTDNFLRSLTLEGLRPDDVYYNNKPDKPGRNAKTVPCNIEQHFFRQTRVMGYRLKKVA